VGSRRNIAAFQELQDAYGASGFTVLGFPCNQFMGQEPGSAEEIAGFCETNYSVSFPMFDKIEVNGAATHPLFGWLKTEAPGLLGTSGIKWNFTKFLVDRSGKPVARYAPRMEPKAIAPAIERLLKE
jgi:glutathione peroxidase